MIGAPCQDCEESPAIVERIGDDGLPWFVCAGCDLGPGCRPIIKRGRYSNGKPEWWAECPQCGWKQIGSAESRSTASYCATRHQAGLRVYGDPVDPVLADKVPGE